MPLPQHNLLFPKKINDSFGKPTDRKKTQAQTGTKLIQTISELAVTLNHFTVQSL